MEKFVISKTKNGGFTFDFTDDKGNIILRGGYYLQKSMCLNGIESVKSSSQDSSKFYCKRSINNEPYFNLKSKNGKVIGTSQMYEDKTSRNYAIELMESKASTASIEDLSKKSLKKVFF